MIKDFAEVNWKNFPHGVKSVEIIKLARLTANVSSPSGSCKNVMGTPKRKLYPNWMSITRKPDFAKALLVLAER